MPSGGDRTDFVLSVEQGLPRGGKEAACRRHSPRSDKVKELRAENSELKEVVAEFTLKNRVLKKSLTGLGEEEDDT